MGAVAKLLIWQELNSRACEQDANQIWDPKGILPLNQTGKHCEMEKGAAALHSAKHHPYPEVTMAQSPGKALLCATANDLSLSHS